MWWKWLLFLAMSVMIVFSFITPAPQQIIGESSRIFYYHIPQAWICVIAFAVAMVYSVKYLRTKNIADDDKASSAAALGLIFCILATLSGSIFAKVTWGSFWNWDPRETSIFFILLLYTAYLALRGSIEGDEKRARLSAIYSVLAFVAVPFLIFVVPRMYATLHPDPIINDRGKVDMDPLIRWCFTSMLLGFTGLFFWLQALRVRVTRLERRAQLERG